MTRRKRGQEEEVAVTALVIPCRNRFWSDPDSTEKECKAENKNFISLELEESCSADLCQRIILWEAEFAFLVILKLALVTFEESSIYVCVQKIRSLDVESGSEWWTVPVNYRDTDEWMKSN